MSLETVVEDIRQEAETRAAEIRAAGDEEAEEIVEAAEEDAKETIAAAEEDVERQIAREREQRLSSAELEAKQERLNARRDVLEEVYERVSDALVELSEDRREPLTRTLIEAGASEFESGQVEVYGRADDHELLEEILADYPEYEVAGEVDCLGGVVLESDASRVRVNNTFDAILDDVWEDRLKDISDRLFEQ